MLDNNIPDDDKLFFTLAYNRLSNNYTEWGLRAGEWHRDGQRVDEILQHLAKALNSNEQFEMDYSFQLSITQVRQPPHGSGRNRPLKPGQQHPQAFRAFKTNVLRIQNKDELCCARALVTAKANVDQHFKYSSFKHGNKIQEVEARLLNMEANVPLGPCGYDELSCFALAPSLFSYQIVLVDADRAYLVRAHLVLSRTSNWCCCTKKGTTM